MGIGLVKMSVCTFDFNDLRNNHMLMIFSLSTFRSPPCLFFKQRSDFHPILIFRVFRLFPDLRGADGMDSVLTPKPLSSV